MKICIRRIAALVMVLCTMCFGISTLAASVSPVEPFYIGLHKMSAWLSISSAGAANCKGNVTVRDGYSASVTWELQGNSSGSWKAVQTWTSSGAGSLDLNKTRYVASGCDYQFKITAKVYDSRDILVETATEISDIIRYR